MEEKTMFGKFIAQKRKENNLTQKDLAQRLYVTESAVSKWERGLSYPDITMVSGICDALSITEHELITASDDVRQRSIEKQAKGFRTIRATYSWTFYLLYGASLLICLICNLAVNHTLSWFWIVLASECLAFSLTNVPVLVRRHRSMWTLGACYLSLNLLFLACWALYGGDWILTTLLFVAFGCAVVFLPLVLRAVPLPEPVCRHKTLLCFAAETILLVLAEFAASVQTGYADRFLTVIVPVTLYGALLPWVFMIAIRYIRVNGFFKTAICSAATGGVVFCINGVLHMFLDGEPFALPQFDFGKWNVPEAYNDNLITLIAAAALVAALLFAAGGIVWSMRLKLSSAKEARR